MKAHGIKAVMSVLGRGASAFERRLRARAKAWAQARQRPVPSDEAFLEMEFVALKSGIDLLPHLDATDTDDTQAASPRDDTHATTLH